MAKTYLKAAKDVNEIVGHLINLHYSQLRHAKVRIEVLTVRSDKEGEQPLTLRGWPCYAIVRKTSTKERAAGRADAEIVIDAEKFSKMTERQRHALLDHELHHLEVVYDANDEVKTDTNGRPLLAMKEHDYQVGWFHDIAERYGEDSIEVSQARALLKGRLGQVYFNFSEGGGAEHAEGSVRPDDAAGGQSPSEPAPEPESVEVRIGNESTGGIRIDKNGIHPLGSNADEVAEVQSLLADAIKTIKDLQRASVSGLQRRLRIGYNRAAGLMDALEKLGVVGPEKGSEPREILVDLATYQLPAPVAA